MNLATPEKVRKLQTALHAKAKGSPDYCFYLLYDKLYRKDVLTFAYRCCAANGGATGVDGQTFTDIETYGIERWLGELTQELRTKTYRPQAVAGCGFPNPTASRDRWESPRSRIGWCRCRQCWSWGRSSRPTCRTNCTPTDPVAVLWTLCERSGHSSNTGILRWWTPIFRRTSIVSRTPNS